MKHLIITLTAALLLSGCGQKDAPAPEANQPAAVDQAALSLLTAVVGKAVVETDNMSIPAIKATAKAGQTVTLDGKIMGADEPFVENRAVMVIGDAKTIKTCELNPDEACPTPWDACCVDSETIQAGTATVQVVGEDGKPLHAGLKGVKGLKELSLVRVSGTVAEGSSPDILIVNAQAIEIQ